MSPVGLSFIRVADGLLPPRLVGRQATRTTVGGTSTLRPVPSSSIPSSSKTQSSTNSGASSQTSSSAPSSSTSGTTTGSSATNSPVASSSVPSLVTTSSTPSETPTPSSISIVVITSSDTLPLITSVQASPSSTPSQSSSSAASFFHNKPAMIAVFTTAGLIALVMVFVLVTIVLRRSRRKGLVEGAIDFSPTTEHLVGQDDDRGGSSSSSDSLSSEARFSRTLARGPSLGPGTSASGPAPASVPVSAPAPREMQQQGPRTSFVGARYAYGSSAQAHPYYDTVRQQQQQQPQRQQPRQVRWQQQEEPQLPPELPPSDVVRHPASLVPAYHRDPAGIQAFNVPFAATARKPSRLSGDGGTWGSRARDHKPTQVRLPPPPRLLPKIPETSWHEDESLEDINTGIVEDRRRRSRVLKVVNG